MSHVKMDPYNDRLFMQISRKIKTIGAGLAIAAAASLFAGAPAAQATTMPACEGRTDYYRTINTSGTPFCFAYYGDLYVRIFDVITLSTGNNQGMVTYRTATQPQVTSPLRPKWFTGSFSGPVLVDIVHIR